jgi:hypothetical protein
MANKRFVVQASLTIVAYVRQSIFIVQALGQKSLLLAYHGLDITDEEKKGS